MMLNGNKRRKSNIITTLLLIVAAFTSISPMNFNDRGGNRNPNSIIPSMLDMAEYDAELYDTVYSHGRLDPLAPLNPRYVPHLMQDLEGRIDRAALNGSWDDLIALDPGIYGKNLMRIMDLEGLAFEQRRHVWHKTYEHTVGRSGITMPNKPITVSVAFNNLVGADPISTTWGADQRQRTNNSKVHSMMPTRSDGENSVGIYYGSGASSAGELSRASPGY